MDTNLIKNANKRPMRRRFSNQFKLQIVKQSLEPKASLSALALANDLNANQVFKWRRDYLQQRDKRATAKPDVLLPVVITACEEARLPTHASPCRETPSGHMEITLTHGRIRIEGAVDADTLCTLVQCMRS